MSTLDFSSPTYPYARVPNGNTTLKGAELIPYQLLRYLLDLPDANGYEPQDDNTRPRVRFIKYVWYDSADPLSDPLPTPTQKMSLLFDPTNPALSTNEDEAQHPKGYRLLWQKVRGQSITEAQTLVKCYVGRIFSPRAYHTTIGIRFDITTNVNFETNTKTDAYARAFDIEQAITEALSQINMTGVGAISFLRSDHADNGSMFIWDDGQNVGRTLHCSIDWVDGGEDAVSEGCESC